LEPSNQKEKIQPPLEKYTAKRVPNRSKSVFKNLQLVAATLSCLKSLSSIPSRHRKLMLTVGKNKNYVHLGCQLST
jgi:hypothetical protein